jgi:hypothetical protein
MHYSVSSLFCVIRAGVLVLLQEAFDNLDKVGDSHREQPCVAGQTL